MASSDAIVPAPNTILNNILSTLNPALQQAGVASPQLTPNSDFYNSALALTNQLAVAFNNINILYAAAKANTATGSDLDALANSLGVYRKAATSSSGFCLATVSSATFAPAASQLTSNDNGLIYQTTINQQLTVAGNNGINNYVSIESVDTGSLTNLPEGSVLSWVNTPGFAQQTCTVVYTVGLQGGLDAENDASLRARLLSILQSPPLYGNWTTIVQTVSNASPGIASVFVYPAANGPSTQGIVFVSAQSPSNIVNRGVLYNSSTWQLGYSAATNNAPGYVQTIVPTATGLDGYQYSVANISNDLCFSLNIPYPVGSLNNGIGGGWINSNPFPKPTVSGIDTQGNPIYGAQIVSEVFTNSTNFSFIASCPNAAPDPGLIVGSSKISWISDQTAQGNGWVVISATILAATLPSVFTPNSLGYSGKYTVTIDTPFVYTDSNGNSQTVGVGDFIFPSSVNEQDYLDNIVASFANLGPGQINTLQVLFPNSYRQPLVSQSYPDVVDDLFCQSLVINQSEVEQVQILYQLYAATINGILTQSISDEDELLPLPGNAGSPGIFVPTRNKLAWYPTPL